MKIPHSQVGAWKEDHPCLLHQFTIRATQCFCSFALHFDRAVLSTTLLKWPQKSGSVKQSSLTQFPVLSPGVPATTLCGRWMFPFQALCDIWSPNLQALVGLCPSSSVALSKSTFSRLASFALPQGLCIHSEVRSPACSSSQVLGELEAGPRLLRGRRRAASLEDPNGFSS